MNKRGPSATNSTNPFDFDVELTLQPYPFAGLDSQAALRSLKLVFHGRKAGVAMEVRWMECCPCAMREAFQMQKPLAEACGGLYNF